jgi:CRP/FNR family cyclic AMP-dependent transcriptional regulator
MLPTMPESPLARISFFAALGDDSLQALEQVCRRRVFARGETLFYEDDPGSALYILQSGQVKIVRLAPDGEERILNLQGPGECLGELSLIDGAPRSARAVALDRVEALVLYREPFLELLTRHPPAALAVMSALAGTVRRLSAQLQDLTALNVPGRLAKKLLELADTHGRSTPAGLHIPLPLTQQELAHMIAATRVAVNQALGAFRQQGLLTTDRQGITLHHPEKLRECAY